MCPAGGVTWSSPPPRYAYGESPPLISRQLRASGLSSRGRRLVRRRLAVQLHHLPVDEAAEEEDRVELEQLLHREQLLRGTLADASSTRPLTGAPPASRARLLALRQRERRQLRQVVPPAPVQVQVPLPDGEHAPQSVPRVARQLGAHLERLARREDAAQRVPGVCSATGCSATGRSPAWSAAAWCVSSSLGGVTAVWEESQRLGGVTSTTLAAPPAQARQAAR